MLRRSLLLALLILSGVSCFAQFSNDQGVYLKGALSKGVGLQSYNMHFSSTNSFFDDVIITPGGSYSLLIGTGFRTRLFDFELTAEEALTIGSHDQFNSIGDTFSSTFIFFKTHIYTTTYLNFPFKFGRSRLRIGLGPYVTIPGKLKVTIDKEDAGYAVYDTHINCHFDVNVVFNKPDINPGIRLKLGKLNATENTFTDSPEVVENLDISSIDCYFGWQF